MTVMACGTFFRKNKIVTLPDTYPVIQSWHYERTIYIPINCHCNNSFCDIPFLEMRSHHAKADKSCHPWGGIS